MAHAPIRTQALPAIAALQRGLQSSAMLDAIFMPESLFRNYAYSAHWNEGEELGCMRNESGDTLFALFTRAGAVVKGVECEEPPLAGGLLGLLPAELAQFAAEPAFEPEDVTFCFWRQIDEESWSFVGCSLEAALRFLAVVCEQTEEYARWALSYYTRPVVRSAIARVFSFEPLTIELVAAVNPDARWQDVSGDASEIGYPIASGQRG